MFCGTPNCSVGTWTGDAPLLLYLTVSFITAYPYLFTMYWFVTVTTGPPWDCAPAPYGSATSSIKIAAGKKTPLIECARAAAMLILIVLRRAGRRRLMMKNEPLTDSHPLLPNLDQEIIEEMLLR